MKKSVPVQIIDSIKEGDARAIEALFAQYPEQVDFVTPFGGQSWVGYAAQIGKLDSIKALIKAGVDPTKGDTREGRLPISSAAHFGHYDVVEFFINIGTDLDVTKSVGNPLFGAIVGRSPEIVELLLRAGIDSTVRYDSPSMDNMDAVAFALMRGETECAKIIALWNSRGDKVAANSAMEKAEEIAIKNTMTSK